MHPSDATLLALVHGELTGPTAERERAHLAGCVECAARESVLRSSERQIGSLLAMLDHPVPRRPAPASRVRPPLARPALAASLALLLAAAAAAAVPGTAVNRWVNRRLGRVPAAPAVVTVPSPAPAQAAGVELPGAGVLAVEFTAAESGGVLIVTAGRRSGAALHAVGGDVAYQVAKGRIGVDNRRPAGRYTLEVPAELERLTVLLAGRVVFDSDRHPLGPTPDTISLSPEPAR